MKAERNAFTLTEVVVATAIVGLLAALVLPVFAKAREASHETTCVSNFRQIYLAVSNYRSTWEGTEAPASSDQMGFPMFFSMTMYDLYDPRSVDIEILNCRGRGHSPEQRRPLATVQFWAPPRGTPLWRQAHEDDWIRHVTKMGSGSIIFYDPNHQLHYPVSGLSTQRALGLRMDGSAKWRIRRGWHFNRTWWEDD